jgi:LL-diaminopimelate aminotransferase
VELEFSNRVKSIKELIFRRLDVLRNGDPDLIDLSRGLPLGLPPREVLYELNLRLKYPENHIYTVEKGLKELRNEVAYFYKDVYDVDLDPETEVQILMGGKDGLAAIVQACVNPGEHVIVPDPSFPAYVNCVLLAGGVPTMLPLREETKYVPTNADLEAALKKGKTKLMYINYPHNPTGASCTLDDFKRFVDFSERNNVVGCYDSVYREISYVKHPTLLQVKGAKSSCVEIGSLSKTFDMVGWRMAYMVGNKDIIAQVRKVKSAWDVGQFVPVQYAAALALKMTSYIEDVAKRYAVKMTKSLAILKELGYDYYEPTAGFFIWIKLPKGFSSSEQYMNKIWEDKKLLLMPGVGFGASGEGYFRVSTTSPIDKIQAGLKRLDKVK